MSSSSAADGPGAAVAEVEIGQAPNAALGEVIVSTLEGEGIDARLLGTRILVPLRFQHTAREILDFLRSEIAKGSS